jgi:DNA-directed RNA polymerase subunit RPC12/RpoP
LAKSGAATGQTLVGRALAGCAAVVNTTREMSRGPHILRDMNILLDCAWCGDEVVFSVDEADDELVCSACNTHMAFAPDPSTTYALLYEAAQAA